jgi:hypothetical protein
MFGFVPISAENVWEIKFDVDNVFSNTNREYIELAKKVINPLMQW